MAQTLIIGINIEMYVVARSSGRCPRERSDGSGKGGRARIVERLVYLDVTRVFGGPRRCERGTRLQRLPMYDIPFG